MWWGRGANELLSWVCDLRCMPSTVQFGPHKFSPKSTRSYWCLDFLKSLKKIAIGDADFDEGASDHAFVLQTLAAVFARYAAGSH